MKKHANPGEAITLRNNINKAEKALTISILNRWAYAAKAEADLTAAKAQAKAAYAI